MRILTLSILLLLTGCASPVQLLAKIYDGNDQCQNPRLDPGYQYPSWCGGGGRALTTRDFQTNRALYVTR